MNLTIPNAPRTEASIDPTDGGALVVGRGQLLEELVEQILPRAGFLAPIHQVDSYIMALGQIHETGSPAMVIGNLNGLDGSAASTVAALRHLAPKTRLLLVVDPNQETEAVELVRAGFDAYLVTPIDPMKLARAGGFDVTETLQSSNDTREIEEVEIDDQIIFLQKGDLDSEMSADASPAPDQLGDIDLLEQLLQDQRKLRDLALKLIETRSQFRSLGLASNFRKVPKAHRSAEVSYQGHTFGHLHAEAPSGDEQLQPWAQWLARWMAVEQRQARLWEMAVRDELTDLWNRRYFNRFLKSLLSQATCERFHVTLMLFDIDDFKLYNDHYGHAAGDDILREAGRLMHSVVRDHDVVARVGGDEFAVIFWDADEPRKPNSHHPKDVMTAADRFQRAICNHMFPKLLEEAPGTLTISAGLASFPWDGRSPKELLEVADRMALASKKQGKNAITFGPGAKRVCSLE